MAGETRIYSPTPDEFDCISDSKKDAKDRQSGRILPIPDFVKRMQKMISPCIQTNQNLKNYMIIADKWIDSSGMP